MGFRFIHAADIHLDSPLRGLSGENESVSDRIRKAPREAFDNLIGRAIDEEVDFAVIAGDLYDGDWRDYQTGLFFVSRMGRLAQAGIPVFLLYGNHDAESLITRRLSLPDNVTAFASKCPDSHSLDNLGVVLHGQSYHQRDITENLVPAYPEPVAGMFNIGVLHTGLGGMGGHMDYAPCSLADLANKGYDYWALGHVHQRQIVETRPHIVFPGNLQGRHIREAGVKGALLVSVEDREVTDVATLAVDVVRWAQVEIDVQGCDRMSEVTDLIRSGIERAVSEMAENRLLACRLTLLGRTSLHGRLLASVDELHAEARAAALGLGHEVAWIERLVVNTAAVLDAATLREREDALGDIRRLLDHAGEDPVLSDQLRADIGDFLRKLPHEVRQEIESPLALAALDDDYVQTIQGASDYLMARLGGDET
ncbi:MAG: metallophosphoesterase family protein [Thiogranum sp.]